MLALISVSRANLAAANFALTFASVEVALAVT